MKLCLHCNNVLKRYNTSLFCNDTCLKRWNTKTDDLISMYKWICALPKNISYNEYAPMTDKLKYLNIAISIVPKFYLWRTIIFDNYQMPFEVYKHILLFIPGITYEKQYPWCHHKLRHFQSF